MKKSYYYFLILGIFWSPLYAQEKKMERAAEAIANHSYAEAKEILWPMTKKADNLLNYTRNLPIVIMPWANFPKPPSGTRNSSSRKMSRKLKRTSGMLIP